MDGQTALSVIIGAVISFVTFWLGYRQTVGAKEERIRAANSELISSAIKRVAVERQPLSPSHFASLRQAKSYARSIDANKLITYSMINSIVFSEIIDNNFLDKSSKDGIISLVQFEKDETPSLEFEKYESLIESKYQESYLTKFAQLLIPLAASATIGLLASKIFIEQGVKEFLNGNSAQILENLAITLTVVAILAVVYSIRQRRYLSKNFIQVEGRGDE